MDEKIIEIAQRLVGMRDVLGITAEEMATDLKITKEEYLSYERGEKDYTFTFLYKAANRFGIDMTELMTGMSPHLSDFTVVRKDEGLPIERRAGFEYKSVAHRFKDRCAEIFMVLAPFESDSLHSEIPVNSHEGQEFDYIVEGSLRMQIGEHQEILHQGDTIFYDATIRHGMVAIDGDCRFLATIIKK